MYRSKWNEKNRGEEQTFSRGAICVYGPRVIYTNRRARARGYLAFDVREIRFSRGRERESCVSGFFFHPRVREDFDIT